jgi:hypothetical protein
MALKTKQVVDLDTALAMLETVQLLVSETLGDTAKSAEIALMFARLHTAIDDVASETVENVMSVLTAAELSRAIITNDYSNDELNQIVLAIKFARKEVTRQAKRNLSLGDTVKYRSTKMGREVTGTVKKIAIKYVTVDCGVIGMCRVPAALLTVV